MDTLDEAGNIIGQEIDLSQSIYIDWGAFINAIINFMVTAFVLFCIVKVINHIREKQDTIEDRTRDAVLNKVERKELRAHGIKRTDRKAVKAYFDEKERVQMEKAAAEAEAKAAAERAANPTTEDLLKEIIVLLKKD